MQGNVTLEMAGLSRRRQHGPSELQQCLVQVRPCPEACTWLNCKCSLSSVKHPGHSNSTCHRRQRSCRTRMRSRRLPPEWAIQKSLRPRPFPSDSHSHDHEQIMFHRMVSRRAHARGVRSRPCETLVAFQRTATVGKNAVSMCLGPSKCPASTRQRLDQRDRVDCGADPSACYRSLSKARTSMANNHDQGIEAMTNLLKNKCFRVPAPLSLAKASSPHANSVERHED